MDTYHRHHHHSHHRNFAVLHRTSTACGWKQQDAISLAGLRKVLDDDLSRHQQHRLLAADGDGVGVVTSSRDVETPAELRHRRVDDSVDRTSKSAAGKRQLHSSDFGRFVYSSFRNVLYVIG